MINVLLINPELNKKYPQPPLGLLSLATVLQNEKYNVRLLDMNLMKGGIYQELKDVDICGISTVSPTFKKTKELIDWVWDISRAKILVGGAHASALPEKTLEETMADVVVVGEGENAILEAVESEGIVRKNYLDDLDNLPIPNYDLLEWGKYNPHPPHGKRHPCMPMITSRGCPYQCVFCSNAVYGRKYRAYSAERVIEELKYLKRKYGVKEVIFYDDVFTLAKKRTYDLCELMQRENLDIIWSCETRVDLVDKELLTAMKKAGCFSIAYGIESGSEEIMKYLCKGIEYWQVYKAIKDTHDLGIDTIGYFMFVPEKETLESIDDTMCLAKRLNMDFVQFSKMTPLPGSRAYKNDDNYQGYAVFDNQSQDDIDKVVKWAYKQYYLSTDYVTRRIIKSLKSWDEMRTTFRGVKMFYGN